MNTDTISFDPVFLNFAQQIANQALLLSKDLTKLSLDQPKFDGITLLQTTLKLIPESTLATAGQDKVRVGTTGQIGSTMLTNEQATATCYSLRAKLVGYRPFGAEIIQAMVPVRSALDETIRKLLLIDWNSQRWNPELIKVLLRYQALIHSICGPSSIFNKLDDQHKADKYLPLIREELVPECHKIATLVIRHFLPNIASAKAQILENASESAREFDNLWSKAAMPLFKFALFKSFETLPRQTRELVQTKEDLADIREALPEIFASYAARHEPTKLDASLPNLMPEASRFAVDNFRMVSEFADLVDFFKQATDFHEIEKLIVINDAELALNLCLLKIDLIELALELNECRLAQPLNSFFGALVFTSTKLVYANMQLVNAATGNKPDSESAKR